MAYVFALLSGALFGAGLIVSGMSNPRKVLDFLDIAAIRTGGWDPTLLMVFVGALPVMFAAYQMMGTKPWAAERFDIPATSTFDAPLVAGSSMFGIGWGIAGFCPGPAVVALPIAAPGVMSVVTVFIAAMLLGVWLAIMLRSTWTRSADVPV